MLNNSDELVKKEYWVPKTAAIYGIAVLVMNFIVVFGYNSEFKSLHLAITVFYLLINIYCLFYSIRNKLISALQTGMIHWLIVVFFALIQIIGENVSRQTGADVGFVFVIFPVYGQFLGLLHLFSLRQLNYVILGYAGFLLAGDLIGRQRIKE